MERRLIITGECSAGLPASFQTELADHAIQVVGQRGEVLEGFDGFVGSLRILE
jgi:hypothetical protein